MKVGGGIPECSRSLFPTLPVVQASFLSRFLQPQKRTCFCVGVRHAALLAVSIAVVGFVQNERGNKQRVLFCCWPDIGFSVETGGSITRWDGAAITSASRKQEQKAVGRSAQCRCTSGNPGLAPPVLSQKAAAILLRQVNPFCPASPCPSHSAPPGSNFTYCAYGLTKRLHGTGVAKSCGHGDGFWGVGIASCLLLCKNFQYAKCVQFFLGGRQQLVLIIGMLRVQFPICRLVGEAGRFVHNLDPRYIRGQYTSSNGESCDLDLLSDFSVRWWR